MAVTVYNQDLALVKEVREFPLPPGESAIRFEDVASRIDPRTVAVRSVTDPPRLASIDVPSPHGASQHRLLVLHGIYGRGRNWLGIARSLIAARPLRAGTVLSADDIAVRSPGQGLSPQRFAELVGRKLDRDMEAEDFFFATDVGEARGGRNLGSANFFPKGGLGGDGEALGGFLTQYYLAREPPDEIVVDRPVEDSDLLEAALKGRTGRAVPVRSGVRGTRARWLDMARTNAALGLRMKASSRASVREQLEALRDALALERVPQRIQCFDVSHTMGESAIASCVVLGPEGPLKSDYRRFNLKGLTPGDD